MISKHFIYFISAFVAILWILLYMQGYWPAKKGELADPDCYMRLNRVVQLHESGKWYDSNYARSNAPYGENLHWTRPLDILLFSGAWLAAPLANFKASLLWWGILVSPFLLAASLMALPWAFRPILASPDSNLTGLLMIFQFGTLAVYCVGRPDHHSLLAFIFIISTGLFLRLIMGSFNKSICYIAGMVSAFSLWIHVESMLAIFLNILLLGIFWIVKDEDFVNKNLHYSIPLLICTGVALILERPWYDLTRIEYDKISLVQLFIFGLISLFWLIIFYFGHHPLFSRQGQTRRFTIALIAAVIVALCVWLIFPDFYRGPYVDIDQRIASIWLDKVSEVMSPLDRGFLAPMIQFLSSAFIGISYICFVLWKEPHNNLRGWIVILAGIMLFTAAGLFERRLLIYGNIMTLVPLAAILSRVLRWEINHVRPLFRAFILPCTIMSFCVAFLFLGLICQKIMENENALKGENSLVPLSQLCDELNELNTKQTHKTRILAFIDYGPEILFRTDYEVVGTPYHRNSQGILDTYNIMTAETDEGAHELILSRKIDMILISNNRGESNFFSAPQKRSTFYNRLRTEGIVDWLGEVELPCHVSPAYRLFRVIG